MRFIGFAAGLALLLGGCASLTQDPTADWTAAEFYAEAKSALDEGNYQQAIDLYGKLEARFPYGPYAEQAQLEVAYAHYKDNDPAAAVGAAERFIKLHPTHQNVDYAYYLRALATFNPPPGFLERFVDQDPAARDPSAARTAFNNFKELVDRFPKSRYAEDAVNRMMHLRNLLARHEILAADYYMRRGAWVAAVNRAKYVIENYQQTPSVADAVSILVTAYREMKMQDLAGDAEQVLKLNHPERQPWRPGEE
ncbi:MAG: outer membrane protein assembly factor BamD [Thiohalomonadaceae bacterium]